MAPSATQEQQPAVQDSDANRVPIKPYTRPPPTSEELDWAPLAKIDLSYFDEPGGKAKLSKELYEAVTKVGFWIVVGHGIDDERVLRQLSYGNAFFKEPLSEKRTFPCNFAEGEYFGYRENSRWIGDTGVKENIEMVSQIKVLLCVGSVRSVPPNCDSSAQHSKSHSGLGPSTSTSNRSTKLRRNCQLPSRIL